MKTICIVTCGKEKIWKKNPNAGPTPAKDVYTGTFAKKCQEYAQVFYPDSYYILSAKYGFLHPSEIIPETYDVTFKDANTNPMSISQLIDLAREKGLYDVDQIIVIAGKDYVQIVRDVFQGKKVIEPLKGCRGNGEMTGKMKNAIKNGMPLE